MASIFPFRALRYDPARVQVGDVVTQPYDKITVDMQERYHAASPYNLVRIILGKRETADNETQNTYSRAAGYFADWRKRGIFLQDVQPSIYWYVQRFAIPGGKTEAERRGFIALGKVEDYSAGVVFRHEQTLAKPKTDRLNLLRATRAHFGQIFMLYSDPAAEIEGTLTPGGPPQIEVRDEYGVLHQLWTISDPGLISLVQGKMRDKKLIIADGHHRYETALSYRNERRAAAEPVSGIPREHSAETFDRGDAEAASYEMMMMTFINMDSAGLVILPTHRVVHDVEGFTPEALHATAKTYFSVEEVDSSIDAARANAILRQAGLVGPALLAVTATHVFLLDRPKADPSVFGTLSLRQQSLDVVQLHKCMLEGALELSEESIREQKNLSYVRDTAEAIDRVRSGGANVAFLMNPVRMPQVRDIAFAGEVLPQKSTDFYPKLLSGLTIYALE
jgi:uncharacterized protein (DUF1015 family)